MWLIVGLGNPGSQYALTRHNIGFMTVDRLIYRTGALPCSSSSFHGELYKTKTTLFLKPITFMNLSGISLQAVKNFYKIDMQKVVVIHDDLDLEFSTLRIKRGGGNGGHNGLKSIDSKIGKEYIRLRMGIGKPIYKSQVSDYVLSNFNTEEQKVLPKWIEHACDAAIALNSYPLDKVASLYTVKKPKWIDK